MITYEIKINGHTVKRVDARRIRERNESMDKTGYEYAVNIYDYENERFQKKTVIHKYQDGCGKLLYVILNDNL